MTADDILKSDAGADRRRITPDSQICSAVVDAMVDIGPMLADRNAKAAPWLAEPRTIRHDPSVLMISLVGLNGRQGGALNRQINKRFGGKNISVE